MQQSPLEHTSGGKSPSRPSRSIYELKPLTGRTHQLRVHCAALDFPVVVDTIYGRGGPRRLQLHAKSVTIPLYKNRGAVTVEAPLPEHNLNYFVHMPCG